MGIIDLVTYIPIVILVITLFYLSNKEIKKSLEVSRISEELLAKERDTLRVKVEQRTKELHENRLVRLNELAKAAEFGRLSQGLFHDLLTPLTSIMLRTEKLKDSKIKEASDRMSAYIKDIRSTLSNEESEKTCNLVQELETTLHLLEYKIRNSNIVISVNKSADCTWFGNPIKIRQIFMNLLVNSIDSLENQAEKKIEISFSKVNEENVIKIKDSGCGIDKRHLDKIFEPFFTTKPTDKGTGIGLTTVKSIVENNLHGTIKVESEISKGSLFTINFLHQAR